MGVGGSKAPLIVHLTPVRIAVSHNQMAADAGVDVGKGEPLFSVGGSVD